MTDPNVLADRRARLAAALSENDIDAAALVPGPSFYYLTGIHLHLMERPTVLFVGADGRLHAVIPSLEGARWQAGMPNADTEYWQDSEGPDAAFSRIAARMNARRLGVEGQRMRVFECDLLRSHFGADAVGDAQDTIAGIRLLKDAREVECQKRAIAISETALRTTIEQARAGMSEREIQQRLQIAMLESGAEGFAFEPIVLTGAMSADPHGEPSGERRLRDGDPLLIDFGALYGGYSADLTRTFFCGHASDEHRSIYETVKKANAEGRAQARPGISAHDLDMATTGVLRASPHAELIVHKTGHGLGLDVHEAPQIMEGNGQALLPGMVFTVEPGLYRSGDIGVRIEDDVLVTEDGSVSLSSFERELTIIGG
ncbi:Xaa-Pro peptidase family protein [Nitratireductor sp. XY-223]|uniref:M24 family metallopeptidase n=1 Tax=Nitratireductor sp. XY-223 TaxID=2561926 RepID=UPI0010AA7354|nr:Xaa-Pro peptidase family protein [Nitratireductor sp. XY-223]